MAGICLWVALGSGCRRPAPPAEPVAAVARVGDAVITAEDYQEELKRLGGGDDERQREAVLEGMIRTELLNQQASATGFDSRPSTRRKLRQYLARLYETEWREGFPEPPLPAGAAEQFHREHPEQFLAEERVRVAGVLVRVPAKATDDARERARERAEAIRNEAAALSGDVQGLGDLARRHSGDPSTRYQGGDLGWLTVEQVRSRWGAAADTVLGLRQPGEVGPLVATDDGFWVLRLIGREPAGTRPWSDPAVQELAAHRAALDWHARHEAAVEARLREGIRVEINRSALPPPSESPTGPGTPPPALPR